MSASRHGQATRKLKALERERFLGLVETLRAEHGWSERQAMEFLGLSLSHAQQLRRDPTRGFGTAAQAKVCDRLKISRDYFLVSHGDYHAFRIEAQSAHDRAWGEFRRRHVSTFDALGAEFEAWIRNTPVFGAGDPSLAWSIALDVAIRVRSLVELTS